MIYRSYLLTGLLLLATLFPGLISSVSAQERCASRTYQQVRRSKQLVSQTDQEFEGWLQSKQQQDYLTTAFGAQPSVTTSSVKTIPVVVHIIHQGEAYGEGSNIPDEQILEQIRILNEDFRRLNTDTTQTPADFQGVAADSRIEFKLAQRDPEGLATTGIIRVQGAQDKWGFSDDALLKAQSFWPSEDYLNIWVTELSGNLLGFAQFPVSDLPGLEDAQTNRLTDGIVITYDYFGQGFNATEESKGRTATHEIGHYLGLRHIWGDGACFTDDYCNDTPPASYPNYGCPTSNPTSCGEVNMFQNFMDYTEDACMNLFTLNQAERMHIVMENSPRRKSLLESKGDEAPVVSDLDMGIKSVTKPLKYQCDAQMGGFVTLRNYGKEVVNSFTIQLTYEGVSHTIQKDELNLETNDTINVAFPDLEIEGKLSSKLLFLVTQVNGETDQNPDNNTKEVLVEFPSISTLPFEQDFEGFSKNWRTGNPDNGISWKKMTAPAYAENNQAMKIDFFNYSNGIGETDSLIFNPLNLKDVSEAYLTFDLSFATYSNNEKDSLLIYVSTDCGNTFREADLVYRNGGKDLATVSSTTFAYTPKSKKDWKTETIDISAYAGQPNVNVAFVSKNDWGNNLYLDNIKITNEKPKISDLMISNILRPSALSCEIAIYPAVEVVNTGEKTAEAFKIKVAFTGATEGTYEIEYEGPGLKSRESLKIEIPELVSLQAGESKVKAEVIWTDQTEDYFTEDNTYEREFLIDTKRERIPVREHFENDWENALFYPLPNQADNWEITQLNDSASRGNVVKAPLFRKSNETKSLWLISKTLDFSDVQTAGLSFELAYAQNDQQVDGLALMASFDCGITFEDTLWVKTGKELATAYREEAWEPEADQWKKEFIELNLLAGMEDVRLAFVAINGQGNNIYLDNFEFYQSDEDEPVQTELNTIRVYPNPNPDGIIHTTFNLEERQDLQLRLFDAEGQLKYETELTDMLNQTYQWEIPGLKNGLYLMQVSGKDFKRTERIIIQR